MGETGTIPPKTRLIFLRHADTQKNPSTHASEWGLSVTGNIQAEEVSKLPIMNSVDIIYVSEEPKTALTVAPLSKKLEKKVHPCAFFNEVKRGDTFLTKEDFETEKIKQLQDLSYGAFGGETGIDALTRFKQGVEEIQAANKNRNILVVTHGTVLNLYFADLLNTYTELPVRWNNTPFCAVGIVEDGKVLQDIVS